MLTNLEVSAPPETVAGGLDVLAWGVTWKGAQLACWNAARLPVRLEHWTENSSKAGSESETSLALPGQALCLRKDGSIGFCL